MELLHLLFTHMPGGVTVGDSVLYGCVPCLSSAFISLCLLIHVHGIVPSTKSIFMWLCSRQKKDRILDRKQNIWDRAIDKKRIHGNVLSTESTYNGTMPSSGKHSHGIIHVLEENHTFGAVPSKDCIHTGPCLRLVS